MRARLTSWTAAAVAAGTLLATPARAEEVSATGKGITGGALLGAEAVVLVESAVGVRNGWWHLLGAVVGGGGGAYGGYLVEQGGDAKTTTYMLAGGMALVIPSLVASLQATSYHASDDYTEDRPAVGVPASEPPRPGEVPGVGPQAPFDRAPAPAAPRPGASRTRAPSLAAVAPGLVQLGEAAGVRWSVPGVEVRPAYTQAEIARFGVAQAAELRVPLVSASF